MTEVAQGTSLARFGDGELLIMAGKDAKHQKYNASLRIELLNILDSSPCLVAVPHAAGNRSQYWIRFLDANGDCIEPSRWYGSAFVSRGDEVLWSSEFLVQLHIVLDGRNPMFVCPVGYPVRDLGDKIICASENAYDDIDDIEETLIRQRPTPAILCCGPTATVLADRLTRKGIWAVDLGNFGKFL